MKGADNSLRTGSDLGNFFLIHSSLAWHNSGLVLPSTEMRLKAFDMSAYFWSMRV